MKRFLFALIMIIATCLCAVACGYSTKSSLPVHIKTIAVGPFANKIDFQSGKPNVYVPLLEVRSHDAVINQFLFDGNLRIAEQNNADLVLNGELIGYERSALRFTDNDDVHEYRITITVRLTMLDDQGELMWEEPSFSGEDTYFLSGPNATSEDAAIEDAIRDLAKRIVARTVEDW